LKRMQIPVPTRRRPDPSPLVAGVFLRLIDAKDPYADRVIAVFLKGGELLFQIPTDAVKLLNHSLRHYLHLGAYLDSGNIADGHGQTRRANRNDTRYTLPERAIPPPFCLAYLLVL